MLESLAGLAVLLLEGLCVCVVAAIGYGLYALTHPARRTYAIAVARGRPGQPGEVRSESTGAAPRFESWTLRSRGRDLPVWDIAGEAPGGPVVIFTHGWGDSRIGGLTRVPAILPLASRLVLWDMPGHGEAKGTCAMGTREHEDLAALIERVREPGRSIVLFGWSLGAVVSIWTAARAGNVAAVIAEAPYRWPWTPARNVMRLRGLPWRWTIAPIFAILGLRLRMGTRWRGFDQGSHAARLTCPLLVIHGTADAVCPVEDGREIAAAGRGALVEIEGGQHSGLWTEEGTAARCAGAVGDFLRRAGCDSAEGPSPAARAWDEPA